MIYFCRFKNVQIIMAMRRIIAPLPLSIWRWNLSTSYLINNCKKFSFMTLPKRITVMNIEKDMYTIQKRTAKKAIVKEQKGKKTKPKVELSEDEMLQVINVTLLQSQLQNVLDKLKKNYIERLSIHTGAGSLENIVVKIDDCEYSLNQIAQISKKGTHLAVLNFTSFPEGIKPTLKAIQESGMNVNPQQDGTVIFIPLPKLTREHRENLAKNAKMLLNQAKDEIREIHNKFTKEAKKQTGLSEDLIFHCQQQIKLMVQTTIDTGEKMMIEKQKELLAEK